VQKTWLTHTLHGSRALILLQLQLRIKRPRHVRKRMNLLVATTFKTDILLTKENVTLLT
jgi:hypothetical protein